MKKIIAYSCRLILRAGHSHRLRCLGFNAPAFRFTLFALILVGGMDGVGVAQAQQPDPLTITKDGNVGIGTPAPANKLSVAGDADFSGNVSVGTTGSANKLLVAGNVGIGTMGSPTKLSVIGNTDFSGKVGIGTADPASQFDLFSTLSQYGMLRINRLSQDSGEASIGFFDTVAGNRKTAWVAGVGSWDNDGDFVIGNENGGNGGNVRLLIEKSGNVAIGTNTPTQAKLVVSGSLNQTVRQYGWLNSTGSTGRIDLPPVDAIAASYSIWAERRIAAEEFNAFSDERLKNIQGRSDSAMDLRTLLDLEITDYRHKDVIAKGNGTYKKVTGQQVEKVFPQAVSKHTEVVPDIYRQASIQDGWITLATDLKKGERVRLISEKGVGVYEVLEVAQDRFRTDFKTDGNRVFVYGREVKDFLTVDYEAISMLNVSATQQIKKEKDEEVKALQDENAMLRTQLADQEKRLSELEARDKARDEKLAAIEAMLLSGNNSATRASSLKKVE